MVSDYAFAACGFFQGENLRGYLLTYESFVGLSLMVFPSKFRLLYLYGVEIGIQFVKWHVLCRAKVDRAVFSFQFSRHASWHFEIEIYPSFARDLGNWLRRITWFAICSVDMFHWLFLPGMGFLWDRISLFQNKPWRYLDQCRRSFSPMASQPLHGSTQINARLS